MVKLSKLKSKEGSRHWRAKTLLYDFITDGRCKFVTNSDIIDINDYRWEYASMEAFVVNNDGDLDHAQSVSGCSKCGLLDDIIGDQHSESSIEEALESRFNSRKCEYNRSIVILDDDKVAFDNDPCNLCQFRDRLDVRFIFDIALYHEGAYNLAVEIVNTSPVKADKKEYCRKNGIDLIVVNYEDVLKSQLIGTHFKVEFYKGGF